MANTLMASSKLLLPAASVSVSASAAPVKHRHLPVTFRRLLPTFSVSKAASFLAASAAAAFTTSPLPALAVEKAALFDFNLTLPIIAAEFLLLMVALDKIYFTPLGKFMDKRDENIRSTLDEVKDMSEEIKALEEEADAVMKAARAEVAAALNKMRRETTAELEAKLAEGKKKVEEELEEALRLLQLEEEETKKSLEADIAKLSDEIAKKVLPV